MAYVQFTDNALKLGDTLIALATSIDSTSY
jgi:hypothetical protein